MSLNQTPSGERVHIGFFGRRNAGKSSVVNAVTGQDLAVVSDVKGTTTDPVRKAMELLPMGPVMITDTPGYDDEGALGALRVRRTRQELNRTDIAVLVTDATQALTEEDRELLTHFKRLGFLRTNCEPLRRGDIHFFQAGNMQLGFTRSYNGQTVRVYVNRSSDDREIPAGRILLGCNMHTVAKDALVLGHNGYCVVLEMNG